MSYSNIDVFKTIRITILAGQEGFEFFVELFKAYNFKN